MGHGAHAIARRLVRAQRQAVALVRRVRRSPSPARRAPPPDAARRSRSATSALQCDSTPISISKIGLSDQIDPGDASRAASRSSLRPRRTHDAPSVAPQRARARRSDSGGQRLACPNAAPGAIPTRALPGAIRAPQAASRRRTNLRRGHAQLRPSAARCRCRADEPDADSTRRNGRLPRPAATALRQQQASEVGSISPPLR